MLHTSLAIVECQAVPIVQSSFVQGRNLVCVITGDVTRPIVRENPPPPGTTMATLTRLRKRAVTVTKSRTVESTRSMTTTSHTLDPTILVTGWTIHRRIRFEMGLASCPTARSRRYGGWFGRDGPGVLPGGSLKSVRFGGSFNVFGAGPTARVTTASRVS